MKICGLNIKVILKCLINTLLVLIISLILNKVLNLDYYDGICICGLIFIISGIYKFSAGARTLPIMKSPTSERESSLNLESHMRANIEIEKSEKDLDTVLIDNDISASTIFKHLLKRSDIELILYGIIILGIGLIKYYPYFI
ncbi:hypothetical protein [Vallitalea sp.]|jgi:hypothetical protein|uniref:hypothetical protein n=1 Tax=Vallitalea sp. TaxID=1882829 RepID=UPI0025FBE93C|nr:hypothetical protein [Vallitalea sp.]MCT4685968.1 hypothetical protein [Vallitalea sp.]